MKAVIYSRYGAPQVLQLTEVQKPVPKAHEILVKIHVTTVTSGDVRLRSSDFPPLFWLPARLIFGLFRPKKQILGHEFAGEVSEIGKNVTKFSVGDAVFGTTTMLKGGSYAEFVCVPQEWKHGVIGPKPKNLGFRESAALPIGGITALFLLEKAGVSQGKRVLVYGASGSVGSYTVQIARAFGALVTGVCSTGNLGMVSSLGAEKVVDYTKQDYSTLSKTYDIVFDAVGKTSRKAAKRVLKKGGSFVSVKMLTNEKQRHLSKLTELAESEQIVPFIDRSYPLVEIVAAHRYVDTGRKKGNVGINVIS